jgi:hypothetical protein
LIVERQPVQGVQATQPAPMTSPKPRRAEWFGSVLAVLGQQVLPFVLDRWMETLEHRSVTPTAIAKVSQPQTIKSYSPGRAVRATPLHRRRRLRKGRNL